MEKTYSVKGENLTSSILFTPKGNGTFEFYERAGFKEFDEMTMMGK